MNKNHDPNTGRFTYAGGGGAGKGKGGGFSMKPGVTKAGTAPAKAAPAKAAPAKGAPPKTIPAAAPVRKRTPYRVMSYEQHRANVERDYARAAGRPWPPR